MRKYINKNKDYRGIYLGIMYYYQSTSAQEQYYVYEPNMNQYTQVTTDVGESFGSFGIEIGGRIRIGKLPFSIAPSIGILSNKYMPTPIKSELSIANSNFVPYLSTGFSFIW